MMVKFAKTYAIEGTAALKQVQAATADAATIIPFPTGFASIARERRLKGPGDILDAIRKRLVGVLDSSEMFCSLMTEDARGCAFGVFTKKGMAVLAAATSVIAVAAIAIGA